MSFAAWMLVLGGLLLIMALMRPVIRRLGITGTLVYLFAGLALGPAGFGVLNVDPLVHSTWLLHASELAVIVSLFTVGMKLRLPLGAHRLRPALCLASVSMVITVILVAAAGVMLLGLNIGAAVLLGGILAPTDPVLASDVQMRDPRDRDKVRLTLSAEGGLNDGTAFPFVMLGLGLLGQHELGEGGWRWWTFDVLWSSLAGFAIGGAAGLGLGRLMLHLQMQRARALAFGEYLVLGLIGMSYGVAVEFKASGFLAVFAAGVALRATERKASPDDEILDRTMAETDRSDETLAANPKTAPAYVAGVLLATNEQLEHLLEVALVLIVGATIMTAGISFEAFWFATLLFVIIRPIAALPLFSIGRFSRAEFGAVAWFGIRGIGSVYYLMFAINSGALNQELAQRLSSLTLTILLLSILAHGVSVNPLLERYNRSRPKVPN
jgi:NhaP-type Na+/H+ or K+/H+ antiporter